ncbi:hypothetical protein [Pseudooceanicola sp. LIPI14-2-Ac024]|uniref:hypothetical protein n=1 Tax=Pseudooceanicola sp. LIPI14-2-Ac024 TaxID=3344875 RepID=UPI0035CFBE8D
MTELEATHSHLYPGATGRALAEPADGPVVIRFSDGSSATGTLDGDRLALGAYTTTAGTRVAPRAFRLAFDPAGGFRVTARA